MDPAAGPVESGQLITQTRRLSLRSSTSSPTSSPPPLSSPSSPAISIQASPGEASEMTAIAPAAADARPIRTPPTAAGRDEYSYHDGHSHAESDRMEVSCSDLATYWRPSSRVHGQPSLDFLPNEVLFNVLGFLDVCDLLATSRANHHFRSLSLSPILHHYRLRRTRAVLPPLLSSPCRPSLAELIQRHIFLTNTSVVSRRLARSLVSIRLARRLAARPSAEALVQRAVLPQECVPGMAGVHVSPALVAKRRAFEKERVKDGLSRWIKGKWRGEVRERQEGVKQWEESKGIGRVWRLRRFWESLARGERVAA